MQIRGLSYDEVTSRIKKGEVNADTNVKTKTIGEIVRTNLFTFFHAINLILFIAILLFGTIKNALFMILVIANAVIGIVQETRAKFLIDKLSLISAPKAIAIRGRADDMGEDDFEEIKINSSEIVLDDVLKLESGFQVCADCVIINGSCEVDESLLTGEPDHILKREGDELMSGSFVTSGLCYVKVIHVGEDNYAAKITKQAKYLKRPNSEIMSGVKKIIKYDGIAILPIGILLFLKEIFITGINLSDAVTTTVAALIGMIPEGLVLLTTIVLAVSITRLSKKNALVQELYSIEMLARVDVLCLDKTGTLTEGKLKVREVLACGSAGYGEILPLEEVTYAAAAIAYGIKDNNPTAKALRDNLEKSIYKDEDFTEDKFAVKIPFSSSRKWSGVGMADGEGYVLGAEEFVFRESEKIPEKFKRKIDEEISLGRRVLVLAKSKDNFANQNLPRLGDNEIIGTKCQSGDIGLPANLTLIGIVIFDDVIRDCAPETLQYFNNEGVEVKIISGDNPVTASQVAKKCNVIGWNNYIDVSTIATEDELIEAATRYTVFGRVTPEQKLTLIKALKAAGHTVAMTGDGVNDVMALKESDCSISPASASDAARNVSQIILLDSNFASMPSIVAEGQRSINNLQRSAALFLNKTVFASLAAVAFLFIALPYPIQPIQISLLSALTIGAPSFVLGLLPNHARVEGHFLRNVFTKALPGGITDVIVVIAASLLSGTFALTTSEISTVTLFLLALVGFMVLFEVCVPFDLVRVGLYIVMIAAFALACIFLPGLFSLASLTINMLLEFVILGTCAVIIYLIFIKSKIFK